MVNEFIAYFQTMNLYAIKFKKNIDISVLKCYILFVKCDEQKPVGRKESGESCRLVRGKEGVLLEFILLAVH